MQIKYPFNNPQDFNYLNKRNECWINLLIEKYPHVLKSGKIDSTEINELRNMISLHGYEGNAPSCFTAKKDELKISQLSGVYKVPDLDAIKKMVSFEEDPSTPFKQEKISSLKPKITKTQHMKNISADIEVGNDQVEHIPTVMKGFHKTSIYNTLHRVISTNRFYPVFISGPTGAGKTTAIMQVCADLGRGLVRANITHETDETDLIGTMMLNSEQDGGGTGFEYGPAIIAAQTGSILLLDELDLGTPKTMCLQPLLEGNPIYIKKTNQWIHPKPGFSILATGNTKGSGNTDAANFVGAQYLNEAFMDRFALWIDAGYPTASEESKLLESYWKIISPYDAPKAFISDLVKWASQIRDAYASDGCDTTISTRRLKNILDHTNIFFDQTYTKNVMEVINRYDPESVGAFERYWNIANTKSSGSLQNDLMQDANSDDSGSISEPPATSWSL